MQGGRQVWLSLSGEADVDDVPYSVQSAKSLPVLAAAGAPLKGVPSPLASTGHERLLLGQSRFSAAPCVAARVQHTQSLDQIVLVIPPY